MRKIWNKGLKTGLIPKTAFKKGQIPWNKGKKNTWTDLKQLSEARSKRKKNFKFSEETKKKMSLARIGKFGGENHPMWKGGITKLSERVRKLPEYKKWRKLVFERDEFICQHCYKRGNKLEAHHMEPFHRIFTVNKIQCIDDALSCNKFWDISNGLTLCVECHSKTTKDKRLKWKVPFVNFSKQYLKYKNEILAGISSIMTKGDLILGDEVEIFEKKLAKFIGTKYAIGVNSGTDALFLSLKILGIGKGDEVITVGHTFHATVEAIYWNGAKPILVNVGEDGMMNVEEVKKAITLKTKAIIPVHLMGDMVNMPKLIKISGNIPIIEDACQSIGSSIDGKKAGSWGKFGCFSFYPAKILGSIGDAGVITTDDEKFAEELKNMRNHYKYNPGKWGFNSRLDSIQASVLNVKIKYLKYFLKRRKEIADIYDKNLRGLILPTKRKNRVYQDYIIRTSKRDELFEYLKEQGIETMKNDYHFPKDCPKPNKTIELEKQTLRLPINDVLEDSDINYVIKIVNLFYDKE